MQLFSYLNFKPLYNETNFMASGSKIIGRVFLKENVNIWFNSVLRGDVNEIHVGKNTNIQDLCMLHVTEDHNLIIGQNVTIGHSVILHGCEVGDSCLVGMGSHILDGAVIGDHCIVTAGSVVPPFKKYPPKSMIMGSPAKVIRELSDEEINFISNHHKSYLGYAKTFNSEDVRPL